MYKIYHDDEFVSVAETANEVFPTMRNFLGFTPEYWRINCYTDAEYVEVDYGDWSKFFVVRGTKEELFRLIEA